MRARTWIGGAALALVTSVAAGPPSLSWVDAHVHYLDFFQETDGMAALLAAMDKAGASHAVVMGTPLQKTWSADAPQRPRYYAGDEAPLYYYSATDAILAEAWRQLASEQRQRLFPFISGFNPTDRNAVDHVERMLALYPEVWAGIGEILTRHDDLTALTQGEVPRADHPALTRVYQLAAERQLPVLLHSNITSKREREPLYSEELERALTDHPRTRFIWAHAGASASVERFQRELPFLREVVERLLTQHDNLYIDLSWTVVDDYLLDDGQPDPAWVALVERFPTRFVVGSDLLGKFDAMAETAEKLQRFLNRLEQKTAARVARENLLVLVRHESPPEGGD